MTRTASFMTGSAFVPVLLRTLAAVLLLLLLASCADMTVPAAPETAVEDDSQEPEETQTQAEDSPAESQPAQEEPDEPVTVVEPANFVLDATATEVRFLVEETLAGNHKLVVGATSSVSGAFQATPSDLMATTFEPVVIDAATFVTDSDRRNGAINRFILKTNAYPEIVFTPTGFAEVPAMVEVGQEFEGRLEGTLSVLGKEIPLSFALSARFASEHEFTGSGTTTISREEWDISVPMPPLVTWVADPLVFEMDFTAKAEQTDQ